MRLEEKELLKSSACAELCFSLIASVAGLGFGPRNFCSKGRRVTATPPGIFQADDQIWNW